MLKPLVPKFRPDFSARLKVIAEKQVSVKLKLTVGARHWTGISRPSLRTEYLPLSFECIYPKFYGVI